MNKHVFVTINTGRKTKDTKTSSSTHTSVFDENV